MTLQSVTGLVFFPAHPLNFRWWWLAAQSVYLGILAADLDRNDEAAGHLAEAMEIHERLRSPYWIARTPLEQAVPLQKRDAARDAGRLDGLLDQVKAVAERFGFVALAKQAARLRS